MRNRTTYSGGSLLVTLVISLVLSVTCLSAVLIAQYSRLSNIRSGKENRVYYNLNSAIELILADTSVLDKGDNYTIDLFGDFLDSVTCRSAYWGIYRLGVTSSFMGKYRLTKAFLYGGLPPDSFSNCLYLADHERPLRISTRSLLKGPLMLPRAGINVNRDAESGQTTDSEEGELPVIHTSNKSLPGLHPQMIAHLKKLLSYVKHGGSLSGDSITGLYNDSLNNSFKGNVIVQKARGELILDRCKLTGQIIIVSDSLITIRNSARLEQVILVAPAIHIQKGVKGDFQVIASNEIEIEDECQLRYPSALVLIKDDEIKKQVTILIGRNVIFEGSIISLNQPDDFYKSYIKLDAGTKMTGILYLMGYLDLSGRVNGSVLTDYFLTKTPALTYENYLINGQINRNDLPEFFLTGPLFRGVKKNKIIQWLQ